MFAIRPSKAAEDYDFLGWMGVDPGATNGNMIFQKYEPKTWQETHVDIKITHCGICSSDLHTLGSGLGPTLYPCCVGHEIVGTAVRVGSKAENGIRYGILFHLISTVSKQAPALVASQYTDPFSDLVIVLVSVPRSSPA